MGIVLYCCLFFIIGVCWIVGVGKVGVVIEEGERLVVVGGLYLDFGVDGVVGLVLVGGVWSLKVVCWGVKLDWGIMRLLLLGVKGELEVFFWILFKDL